MQKGSVTFCSPLAKFKFRNWFQSNWCLSTVQRKKQFSLSNCENWHDLCANANLWPMHVRLCRLKMLSSEFCYHQGNCYHLYNKYMEHSPFQCLLLMLSSFLSFLFCFKSTPPDFFLLLYVRHENNKTVLAFPDFYIQSIPESDGWMSY